MTLRWSGNGRELKKCVGQKRVSTNVYDYARSLATEQKYRVQGSKLQEINHCDHGTQDSQSTATNVYWGTLRCI